MKKFIFLLLIFTSNNVLGQENVENPTIQVELGLVFHSNTLNEDTYLDSKTHSGPGSNRTMVGLDLRFILPTKLKYIDFTFGSLIEKCWDEYLTTTVDFKLNGGGVYAGICPKIKSKYFGITSLFAVGIFSYKEYFAFYRDFPLPVVDVYEKKASFGLGAMSSIGIYGKIGPVGLHPQAQAIFSGGSNASFLFYGFVIPLTIEF